MNEIQRSGSIPDAPIGSQPAKETGENDPLTWVGLVWRIVHVAIGSNDKLPRVCVLICLVGTALWLIVSVSR